MLPVTLTGLDNGDQKRVSGGQRPRGGVGGNKQRWAELLSRELKTFYMRC